MGDCKPNLKLVSCYVAFAVLLTCFLSGCLVAIPVIRDDITAPPVTEAPTETPAPEPTPSPSSGGVRTDAFGVQIAAGDHFIRYLEFSNVSVYEQSGDTFLDAMVTNSYPEPIMCSIIVRFFESGSIEVASANLQAGDGAYALVLAPGTNYLYAQIDTDLSLVELDFELEYDLAVGVQPVG
ncbi:MAG: hypothetical protein Q4B99_04315 [Clostridia bacterium]|nr:hypothetical protein [Clostridia bacterium]